MPSAVHVQDVLTRIARIAGEQVGFEPAQVGPATDLIADLNFDSLDVVEFIMSVEEAFDVNVPDKLAEQVRTVGQAAEMVCKLGAHAPTA